MKVSRLGHNHFRKAMGPVFVEEPGLSCFGVWDVSSRVLRSGSLF